MLSGKEEPSMVPITCKRSLAIANFRASKIASHIGVASAIWIVACLMGIENIDTAYSESLSLGLLTSLFNIIPICFCFKLDKDLVYLEGVA